MIVAKLHWAAEHDPRLLKMLPKLCGKATASHEWSVRSRSKREYELRGSTTRVDVTSSRH